jgi:hypothetical protein
MDGIELAEAQHNPRQLAPQDEMKSANATEKEDLIQNPQFERAKKMAEQIGESYLLGGFLSLLTAWALYQGDLKFAATTKEADLGNEPLLDFLFFSFSVFIVSLYF